jgi:vitamin B12 transporter
MKKSIILCSLIGISMFQTVLAQQKKDSIFVNLGVLDVNAIQKKLYSEKGRILNIIEKTEITNSAVQSLDQLLDYVAGVDIRQRGTNTTQADISLRGGSFDQVLVLLNGVNITDPQTGHFNLDVPLNLSDVSRVEILEGSSARVLGPNAFSGAINIVTESSEKPKFTGELTGGSYLTLGQAVSGNFNLCEVETFGSISHKSSDGYMANTNFNILNGFAQSVLRTNEVGKFTLQLSAQLKDMGENGFYSLKYPNQHEATKTFLTSLDWSLSKRKFSYNAQVSWRNHYDRYELDHNIISGYKYHLTDILNGKFYGSYTSKLGKTTIGLDIRNEHIYSTALGLPMSLPDSLKDPYENGIYFKKSYNRTVYTGLIDHSLNVGKWYFSLGIANSYSADFKFSTYGGFDVSYAIKPDIKIFASANSATRLPTFTDLFFVNPVQQGNPLLKPEQSKTFECGTKINPKQWNINADIFYRLGENVIDWIKLNSSSAKYESTNLASVNALGCDVTVNYKFPNSLVKNLTIAYSYLNMDKAAVGFDSKYALDYLKNKITLNLNHSIYRNLSASWKLAYFDRAGTYDANTVIGATSNIQSYKPYFSLDARILWSEKLLDVFVDLNNILNSTYADYGGLTQPGINFNIGVRKRLD